MTAGAKGQPLAAGLENLRPATQNGQRGEGAKGRGVGR